jgi:hypothetical protein
MIKVAPQKPGRRHRVPLAAGRRRVPAVARYVVANEDWDWGGRLRGQRPALPSRALQRSPADRDPGGARAGQAPEGTTIQTLPRLGRLQHQAVPRTAELGVPVSLHAALQLHRSVCGRACHAGECRFHYCRGVLAQIIRWNSAYCRSATTQPRMPDGRMAISIRHR